MNTGFKFGELVKDFQLVFLNVDINELDDYDDIRDYLQLVRPYIHTFTDVNACLEHLATSWYYLTFLIVSDRSVFAILSQIENMNHITSLFIFYENIMPENLTTICPKILRGAFDSKHSLMVKIIQNVPTKRTAFMYERNVFLYEDDDKEASLTNPDETNVAPFLSAVINTSDSDERIVSTSTSKDEMLSECRLYYRKKEDNAALKQIEEFERTYTSTKALYWYKADKFLYRMVNKALRTKKAHIIDKFRFFIKDLEETLDLTFAKQIFHQWSSSYRTSEKLVTLYRGQRLSQADMQHLQKSVGKRIMINQYISTTKDIQVAQFFAGAGEDRPQFESVIYNIDISIIYDNYKDKPDPCIYYYDISHFNSEEKEVILRIGTIFRVVNIIQMSDGTWHVQLLVEKVDDYRTGNKVSRTPTDIVYSFFSKAAQWKKINIDHIIENRLSSSALVVISVCIRLGHLVKHHPRKQLRYYQAALSNIPPNESDLIELGYWAIRMRCFLHVNDWTSIPLNIYHQTVLHVDGKLRKKLHLELARINEARGAFSSAKQHYGEALQRTEDPTEIELIWDDMEQLNDEDNKLEPVLPSGQFSFQHLYVAILTIAERSLIDDECKVFHQALDTHRPILDFSFPDLLSHSGRNEQNELIRNFSPNAEVDSTVLPSNCLFILSLPNESLTMMVEMKLTVDQLKERIRDSFDLPYPAEYDFRLIHCGKNLIDGQLSLSDCQINHQDIVYLIHGPRIQNISLNSDGQLIEGKIARNIQSFEIMQRIMLLKAIRLVEDSDRRRMAMQNLFTNLSNLENLSTDTVRNEFDELFRRNLSIVQDNDDNNADPVGLSDMSISLANDYIRNSGPQISIDEIPDLLFSYAQENSVDNDTNQHDQSLRVQRSIDEVFQEIDDMWQKNDRLKQATRDHVLNLTQSLFNSDCITS